VKTLSQALGRGKNNFDLIRLMAALAVMLGHSYGVQAGSKLEAMLAFSHLESFASLAVYAFFMISGMLVSASFARQSFALRFIGLRALRIWPGAIVCALFTGLIIGPLFTTLSVEAYFSHTWTHHWLMYNTTQQRRVGGALPGVFEGNHLKGFVNATVWTLPVELKCYLIVLVAGLFGWIGSRRDTTIFVGACAIAFAWLVKYPPEHVALGNFFIMAPAYSFYPVPFFLLGMLLYVFRDYIFLSWMPVAGLAVLYMMTRYSTIATAFFYATFTYGILWLASAEFLRKLAPRHDYSYGIYLYGFVVQQMVASFSPAMNNYLAFAISVPITVILAALSWHLVERPCLASFRRSTIPKAEIKVVPISGP